AVQTLCRDWERMVTFYRFPKDHWIHLRTTNVVESPFSAVRLRTDAARRYKKVANAEARIWKILTIAEKKFRRLNAPELLEQVYYGQRFKDGIQVEEMTRTRRAARSHLQCARRGLGKEDDYLKPFVGTQRVAKSRPERLAGHPEASLGWRWSNPPCEA